MKVLLVDDDQDFRQMLCEMLEHEGYEVESAEDMAGAYSSIECGRPDLVILDIGLPDGDGLTFCRDVTSNVDRGKLPVLILSGRTGLESRMKSFLSGAIRYISKPFDMDYLLEILSSLSTPSGSAGAMA